MKKLLKVLFILLLILAGILAYNTVRFKSQQVQVNGAPPVSIDESENAERLAGAVRIPTVSYAEASEWKAEPFFALHQYLETQFPKVHQVLKKEIVGDYSLLYTWQGKSQSLKPVVLLSHMDVVPIDNAGQWTHPPFDGQLADGYIWGRGTMDDKAGVIGILQATEMLLSEGFQPDRTFYFAFGHDEEIGGLNGAVKIAALLASRGVQAEYVLDEGGVITHGLVPGVSKPAALIGIAEKGFVSVKLSVSGATGHSSMPPPHTTIGVLSQAIADIENHPFPARIGVGTRKMFEYLGPEMPLSTRVILANLWLLEPLLRAGLLSEPTSAAMIRTTTAVTMINGGVKDNVLPGEATAVVNFRILPGDSVKSVVDHVRSVVNNPAVKVEATDFSSEPSFESDVNSPAFQLIRKTIAETFPGILIGPNLLVGATDSRHYENLTHNIIRFLPFTVGKDDLDRIHGVNERISIKDFAGCVRFYRQLILNSAK